MKITFLGTGTSGGVPTIGCHCDVCKSKDPRDKRLRSSVWIQTDQTSLVIDVGPDFRTQALTNNMERLDAALITHFHKDHIAGLDDVKQFYIMNKTHFPIFANKATLKDIQSDFSYAFQCPDFVGIPKFHLIEADNQLFHLNDLIIQPIKVFHYQLPILGFRIGKFAYITDAKIIPETSLELLQDLDVLVLNALRQKPHISHFSLSEALQQIEKLHPKRAFLTHISHQLGFHAEVEKSLPENVFLSYDQLSIEI